MLAGCAHYSPQPLKPADLVRDVTARRLDDPQLATQIRNALPRAEVQAWPPAQFEPADLLAAAIARNADLAQLRAQRQAAMANLTTAGALPNPTIGLALDRYVTAQAGSANWLWAISSDFPLSALRDRRLQLALADRGVRGARLNYADRLWQLRRELRNALREVLLGRRQLALAQEIVTDAQSLDAAMEQRLASGEAAPGERQLALRVLLQAQQDAGTAATRVAQGEAALAQALGLTPPALQGIALMWTDIETPQLPAASQLAQWREQALLDRSDIERALNDYDSRELELQQQVRLQYPAISLGPGYTYDHGVRKLTFNLNLALPLFNRNAGPIAVAEARRAAAGAALEAAETKVLTEIDGAVPAATAALQALANARNQQQLAQQQSARTQREFQAGGTDRPAVLNARLDAAAADQTALLALDRALQSMAQLEDALRMPLDAADQRLIANEPVAEVRP